MKISEEKFNRIYNLLLLIVAIGLPFGKVSNVCIILFVLFNVIFFKKFVLYLAEWKNYLLMLLPLVLEIVFFFNNDSYSKGLKSLEKYISLLFFFIFIIGHYKRIQIWDLLRKYARMMTVILLCLEVRFLLFYTDYVQKYINGVDLWEMGYVFTMSFKVHAPALNLQLVFVCCLNLYFLIQSLVGKKGLKEIVIGGLFLLSSIMHVFVINTRMALFCLIVCFVSMVYFELIKKYDFKKVVLGISGVALFLVLSMGVLFYSNPFMVEKYTDFTFSNLDKIGKLDEMEHPEIYAYNGLVNRLSIWKASIELANKNWIIGVGGADANDDLIEYYINTNQFFLAKYKLATHNQFLNYYLKFGIFGLLATIVYVSGFVRLALRTNNSIIWAFFFLFTISNLTDDFLNRFDGIGFSSFFYSIFLVIYLRDSR
jgi:hypothetical protein